MIRVVNSILFAVFCFANVFGQTKQEVKKYVIAPSENTLLVVAAQPSCPLALDDARALLNTDHSWDFRFAYRLRNTGTKPIRRFSLMFWTSESTGGTLTPRDSDAPDILPGTTVLVEPKSSEAQVIPLTKELKEKMQLGQPMKMVVVLLVTAIEFTDGTRFSDEKTFQSLKQYFADHTN